MQVQPSERHTGTWSELTAYIAVNSLQVGQPGHFAGIGMIGG